MHDADCPAHLHYIDQDLPGITRKKLKLGWAYFGPDGKRITDRDEIDRLNAIGMPPAYENCWFSPDPAGHLQATGFDARGRKQYRYHPDFRASQDAGKYDRCVDFGTALPKLRARVEADLASGKTGREAVIAAVVRLLDRGLIRVGNEGYAKANKSYGATTLRRRHAKVTGSRLRLQFRAKSGKMQLVTISDRSLSRVVRRCQDLPGQLLFQWVDPTGEVHPVGSADVNAYLRMAMGGDFTAKHFRTWGASLLAFEALRAAGGPLPIKALVAPVCDALGNTPAIARKSYIHPSLIAAAQADGLLKHLKLPRRTKYLLASERGLITWLSSHDSTELAKAA